MSANVLIAVLAAGSASRFGANKLDHPCAGKPLGRWVLDAVLSLGLPTVLITSGTDSQWHDDRCEVCVNPEASRGMSSSLALAATIAISRKYDGLLVILADMPLITASLLKQLLVEAPTSACKYPDGHVGAPAFFGADHLKFLLSLSGDSGARSVLANLDQLNAIKVDPVLLQDVDTMADLRKIENSLLAR